MKGTLTVLVMFALGCLAGVSGILPEGLSDGALAGKVLFVLMFLVGGGHRRQSGPQEDIREP